MVPGGLQNTELTVEIPPRCKDPRIQKTTGFRYNLLKNRTRAIRILNKLLKEVFSFFSWTTGGFVLKLVSEHAQDYKSLMFRHKLKKDPSSCVLSMKGRKKTIEKGKYNIYIIKKTYFQNLFLLIR